MSVLITEFMDEGAVAVLAAEFSTDYDPALVDDRAAMLALRSNRTPVSVA